VQRSLFECKRTLREGGLLTFTTFGPGTLRELREAWSTVDSHPHVHSFTDMHDLGDLLVHSGFADPVLDVEFIRLTHKDVPSMLRELRATGQNSIANRHRPALSKKTVHQLSAALERYCEGAVVPTTYEIVFGHAWRAQDAKGRRGTPNEFVISTDRIGRR
jgi:malonyl-CoA O-methyltransferase